MNFFEKIVYFLKADMEVPPSYGAWHITSFVLMLALAAVLVWKFKDSDDKTLRRILLIAWVAMVVSEIYKQVVFSMESDGVTATWSYQWYAFPFQFCSTPLYLLPILIFAKDGKVRNAVMAYMATFSLFAGLAVMIYPNDVFIGIIGINVQTMLHHGLQVVMGVLLVAYNRHHLNKRFFAWCMIVFSILATVAMLMNIVVHNLLPTQDFNMFYISPYFDCTLPVLSSIYPAVPYPAFLVIYILGFALLSAAVYAIEKGIVTLCSKIKHKGEKQ